MGKLVVYQVDMGYLSYTKLLEMNCDSGAIIGITNNYKTMTMVSNNSTLRVVDKLTRKTLDKQYSTGELTSLMTLKDRNIFTITDTTGFIHLYANVGAPLQHIQTFRSKIDEHDTQISCIAMSDKGR